MRPLYAIVPVGSVVVAGVLATAVCFLTLRPSSWLAVIGLANLYVAGAFLVAALTATILALTIAQDACVPGALFDVTVGTAASAAWLPALIVLVLSRSMWSVIPAVLSAAALTLAVRNFAARPGIRAHAAPAISPGLPRLALLDAAAPPRHIVAGFAAGILLEAGMVSMKSRSSIRPALLCALGTSVVTWALECEAGARRTRGAERTLAMFALAVVFTTGAMMSLAMRGYGSGDGSGDSTKGSSAPSRPEGDGTGTAEKWKDLYPGVVLWPARSEKMLLVPPLPSIGPMLAGVSRAHPLSIPFYGAYWYFRRPYTEPPPNSLKLRGSPLENTFVSTGHVPIVMEARQNLGTFIEMRCCDRLQLVISNADRFAGTVAVEVVLVNSEGTRAVAESLGSQPVLSAATLIGSTPGRPVGETLTYSLRGTGLRRFDEIIVRFHLDEARRDTSAKIAIDRFLLVPKRA